jgi:hypothetical protein
MYIKALLLAATVIIAPVSAIAYESDNYDRDVHDRSVFETIVALEERGINAERVEEWGTAVRVDAIDEAGRRYTVMVDKDTLLPFGSEKVRTSAVPFNYHGGSQRPVLTDAPAQSLVSHNNDDDSASF